MDKFVGDLIRYALFLDYNKTPIKREDINKVILKDHKNSFKPVLSAAQTKFKELFGMELVEIPKKSTASKSTLKNNLQNN